MRLLTILAAFCAAAAAGAAPYEWHLPPGFPLPLTPPHNVQTTEKSELGRRLFYDRSLSGNGRQACADCHQQRRAFTDGRTVAVGSTGQAHTLNAMTLTNVAYNTSYTWQNDRVRTLEAQALIPLLNQHPVELGVKGREREIEARLRNDTTYLSMFRSAFPGERRPVSLVNVARAIAAFERTLISGRSPYDRLVYGGDEHALSPSAWRGMELFYSGRAGCSACHRGFTFSGDARYAGSRNGRPTFTTNGVTAGAFRIPSLRNVALTAPYMHDGSIATLDEVVRRYVRARRLPLSDAEQADLVVFLQSLTDEDFVRDPRFANPRPETEASSAH